MRSWLCLTPAWSLAHSLTQVWGLLCGLSCSQSRSHPPVPVPPSCSASSPHLCLPRGACKASPYFWMPLEVLPGLRIPVSPQLSQPESGPAPSPRRR